MNLSPTITLINQLPAITENSDTSLAIKIADVLISDDSVGVNSLSLSGTDAALFELIGTELYLRVGVALDAETRAALSVSVDVDDATIGSTPMIAPSDFYK